MGIVLVGSLLGVVGALLSFLLLDVGAVAALGIWAASGPVSAIIAVMAAARPLRPQPAHSLSVHPRSTHPRSTHPHSVPSLDGEGRMARAG